MDGLSANTAALGVQDTAGDSQGSVKPGFETAPREGVKPRMEIDEQGPQVKVDVSHTLNIVKNIGFLYQEYRDTSKQQEIDLRRQRDGVTVKAEAPGMLSSGLSSPPVIQLRNSVHRMSLWQNLEIVQESGLLNRLTQKQVIMQEAMFELVSSEASYYKSLEILETQFLRNPVLFNTLNQSDMHFLFSNIKEVVKASERFLMDLENRMEQSILISDVCDIVYQHAVEQFHAVFNTYVINQVRENVAFREAITSLEKMACVRGLSFTSFLILPFQRVTRLKLLVQNILKKAEENSEMEANAIKAHQKLEESVPIISHSRWLLKKGEVQLMSGPKSTRSIRSRKLYQPVYLFLFNNLLLITKPNSSGDKFQVLDSCTRAMLRTDDQEGQGQMMANIFNLNLLENQEDRTISYMLKATSMLDDGGEAARRGTGWFPTRVVEEIQNKEVRAQNLKEVLRIQQTKTEALPSGVRMGQRGGRRPPKVLNLPRTEDGQ
ncbi:hypothetical protein NHX12_008172 [Muraenolepis orangiensis]|uniref:DH domain-containing protein n=1 Tax=Muraenolepis orangiensis TaxID=630683 RepID=A0A9Q0I9Y1_9TELE|nr:hypothetical protein NHX12_008172 [Muraenolepis orangiensis]